MICYAFFDTDVLYHFGSLDSHDWPKLLEADQVVLVYAPIIARQLNRHKDNGTDSRMRRKASDNIRRLDEWLSTDPQDLRKDVTLTSRTFDPVIDFPAAHLNNDVDDDWLIATAIEFKKELLDADNETDRVVIVTGDRGLTQKAKLTPGIEGFRMPQESRLPEAEDETERELREVKLALANSQVLAPKLRLGFSDGKEHASFTLLPPAVPTDEETDAAVAKIKRDFPKMHVPSSDPQSAGGIARALGTAQPYSRSEIERYNREIDEFRIRYTRYWATNIAYIDIPSRSLYLNVTLFNEGTVFANNVTVLMSFPDGYKVRDGREPLKPLHPPEPPSKPRGIFDPPNYTINPAVLNPPRVALPQTHAARGNVLGPKITNGANYTVQFEIERVKHGIHELLPVLVVMAPNYDDAKSFSIECEIHGANLPKKIKQRLHVVIRKQDDTPEPA